MRIAETTRSHALVALGAVGLLALAGTLGRRAEPEAPGSQRVLSPWRGCGQGERTTTTPAPDPGLRATANVHSAETGTPYRDVLLGARDRLQACATDADVRYRLALTIGTDGRVLTAEVKADAADLADIDLKVVKCLELAAAPLAFPRAPHEVRISTFLRHEARPPS